MILSDAQARQTIDTVLALASADQVRVNLGGGRRANTRFALNSVTTCGDTADLTVAVTACYGRRHATATTRQTDRESLQAVVERAEALARVAPEDSEHMPELGPQDYLDTDPWRESTAAATPTRRAEAALEAVQAAEAHDLTSFGYFEHGHGFSAVGNSEGLFAWSRATDASFTATMRTEGGASSGWGASTSRDIDEIDDTDATHRATEKALAGRQPQPLEPGTYPVILEPQAVADLLGYLVGTMDARRADEGRSFFTKPGGGNRTGEKIVGENITIRSDPTHPDVPATPFQGDGLPTQRHAWVDRGVLRQLVYDRFWAAKQGVEPTGYPANLIVEGGTGTVDDLVAAADRAILVTRFWYIRFLDPQTLLLTGLTRDGLFWVEDGEVRHGLRNFRFNESPIALLGQVTALSEPVRVGRALVPAVAASGFTFSSESASV